MGSFIFFGCVYGQTSMPADTIVLKPIQVAPHTYFVQGFPEMGSSANQNFISNAGFVVTPKGVVVVDALGSPTLAKKLIGEIARITPQKVVAVVVSHYHADHVYGLQEFKRIGAKIYAQGEGRNYLSSETARQRLIASRIDFAPWVNANTSLISADVWIDKQFKLNIGGIEFFISRVGPAHAPEDLMVYVPSEKVLFAGDLVFRGRIPFVGNADSKGWLAALNEIERLNPDVVIPGHGDYSVKPVQDIAFTRGYLKYLRQSMSKAALDLDPFEEAYQQSDWSEYEGMPLFRAANRMNAYNVYLSIQAE
ncbi:MBL fold metallo-hydrolase [Polynucleobacter sp. AP-Melu-500A-A1]|uniref:MBL fold metallo-hydrolase n=1 Tax=Polynucleobacter sp. AP-Melu-500A-A1 TaxID=2576929 RepID=UPI002102EE3C|nr:MBL fold metallo-hydrolase [Polynucleobacter sp. AP-Melu-500A-A1]MBU3630393.1 MBL fold metallo-hydrolase [Polynucleobacter sp. AP-Melu-500A-A1]